MMGILYLEVVTPEKVLVSQEVDMVMAPGSEGEFGILPEHINFLSGIVPGTVRFDSGDTIEYMSVSMGFSEVSENRVSILVDSAEKAHDIDMERAQNAMDRARDRLAKDRGTEDIDFVRAEAALKRAVSRVKVAKRFE
ncbi:MAG: F0F1 ATP synthase subunit epsilon [Deltaproteobacteria bacterium]|nr:F0F1 ATP synthase subunit epsilon [Deltaproteobacteria bacterium]MBW1912552.1 F0F1 ATP synthase subunit epsilon [Deltaproteobacteria bacterium]